VSRGRFPGVGGEASARSGAGDERDPHDPGCGSVQVGPCQFSPSALESLWQEEWPAGELNRCGRLSWSPLGEERGPKTARGDIQEEKKAQGGSNPPGTGLMPAGEAGHSPSNATALLPSSGHQRSAPDKA